MAKQNITQEQRSVDQKTGEELFRPGEVVPASGEYELVEAQGNKTDYDIVTLDEGETFPNVQDKNLCFRMVATCLEEEEQCEPL